MKINRIKIENVLGVSSVDVAIDTPITVFTGPNGAGKSSLVNAIKMAMTGDVTRVNLKKDYKKLIKEGQKTGYVMVSGEGFSSVMDLPAGTNTPLTYPALPFCLDPHKFASLDIKERKQFLGLISGVKPNNDMIRERLSSRGCDMDKVEQILPVLRAGFDAAAKAAKDKATEAKGSWKAVTGEAWGSKKGEEWKAPEVESDPKVLAKAEKNLKTINDALATVNQELGGLIRQQKDYESDKVIVDLLERTAAKFTQGRELDDLEDQRNILETEVRELTALLSPTRHDDILDCPHCHGAVIIEAGSLVPYEQKAKEEMDPAVPQLLAKRQNTVDEMTKRIRELVHLKHESNTAKIKLLDRKAITPVDEQQIRQLNTDILELNNKREQAQQEIRTLCDTAAAAGMSANANKRSAEFHAEVLAWSAIGDALSPDGIPGELLAETITPINKRLLHSAHESGMSPVQMTPDMDILYNGRSYNLLSESEQWRTDAMLTEAISFISGLKILMLDRFDVLDIPSRSSVLNWLLSIDDDLETCLVCGTLKKPILGIVELTSHWIEKGTIKALAARAAA